MESIERERIGHAQRDALLQSVQGLILHFRRIALRTPPDAPTRPMMEEAISLATALLVEARDKGDELLGAMHPAHPPGAGARLHAYGCDLGLTTNTAFTLRCTGRPVRLRLPVQEKIVEIGLEAIRHAFQHGRAGRVKVELRFGEHDFQLCVTGNGWGTGKAGRGSRWRLRVPARLAYAGAPSRSA